jgi:3-hydroxyisobutyrate dehydrogenase
MESIGWIGTGVMGSRMCKHLIDADYHVNVYNRTRSKADILLRYGARWQDSPADVAKKSNYIFVIVGYPDDVEQVMFGDSGIIKNAQKDSYIIDMTTSIPSLAENIYNAALKNGISALDAPVSGGDIGAQEGSLAIMVGGKEEVFKEVEPLFELMGGHISYMGTAGKGQHTKMSNQILIAGTMIGVVESLLYAYKMDIDLNEVIEVIGKGAASSWSINNLGIRIAQNDYDPGFFIKHFVKDMRIALEEAHRMELSLPGLALAEQFYTSAMALGYENLGTQGLYKVLKKLNNVEN